MNTKPRQSHLIDRRTFVRGAAGALAAGGLLGMADAPPAPRFIDIHTHLGQIWNHTRELTAEGLLKWMDDRNVERAVVLPAVSPEACSFPLTTDFVLAQTKPHRDRLTPFCAVDPRTSYSGKRHGLKYMLQQWMDRGVKGFGEHKPGVPIDHPGCMDIYAVCGELNLPVLFHLDEQRNTDEPGLPGLEKVLKQNSQTTFIGHGPGWWASVSGDVTAEDLGGYPNKRVAPGGAVDRLMDRYPNLFGDLSADSGARALSRDPAFGHDFLVRRADRLMFGTDYLSPGQEVPQFDVLPQMRLPPDVERKIYRDNARRLLKLDEK